jgi:hypothetical protein
MLLSSWLQTPTPQARTRTPPSAAESEGITLKDIYKQPQSIQYAGQAVWDQTWRLLGASTAR